ncbi:MAG TPA: ubiquinol-cytochrome c reductase iron-sulfur subunit [Rhodocyclaceae bacterium]|nr:ubiquinol-cytochrome c reductase iron-sulfur subunit [Rhodocyclaceae bacterium]HNH35309.1 ubiquinol-cytochrome c reductase iron-sulfur subunit [Rhodocyclaceae bacterium]
MVAENPIRRRLVITLAAAGACSGAAAAIPLLASLAPSERAKAAGAPVEADVSQLPPGEMMVVEWRGKPVWIVHRTREMLGMLAALEGDLADPDSRRSLQPEDCTNRERALRPEFLVVVGICTHLGCSPGEKFHPGPASGLDASWPGGFLCPCHGSTFDLAGRVFRNKPAPTNLEVPPHRYLAPGRLLIGDDRA